MTGTHSIALCAMINGVERKASFNSLRSPAQTAGIAVQTGTGET
jgi:hypothetical protein